MIATRVKAGRAETGMLAQVQWLSDNADTMRDALGHLMASTVILFRVFCLVELRLEP